MAQLKWGGKNSPKAYIVAETPEEEKFIRQYPREITRSYVDGKMAFILSATLPLDYIYNLQKEVSLGSRKANSFPGRILTIPRLSEV